METNPHQEQEMTHRFLNLLSLDALEPDVVNTFCDLYHRSFMLYLPLLLRHIAFQYRSSYKITLIKLLVRLGVKYPDIQTRISWLHRAGGICVCCDSVFLKLIGQQPSMAKSTSYHCFFNDLIESKKSKLYLKDPNHVPMSMLRLEDILDWIAKARDLIVNDLCNGNEPMLYLNAKYLPENLQNKPAEWLSSCHVTVLNFEGDFDPFFGAGILKTITALKSYPSKTKPISMLFDYVPENNQPIRRKVMYKCGDDLRRDMAVQIMFNVFNVLWKQNNFSMFPILSHNKESSIPKAVTYSIIPTGPNEGLFEMYGCVEDKQLCEHHSEMVCCLDGFEFEKYYKEFNQCHLCSVHIKVDQYLESEMCTMVSTLSGGYIASYILGVRDRHLENIKFHFCDKTFAHIDFGYVINLKPKFDANRFAIPNVIRAALMNRILTLESAKMSAWDFFVQNCVRGYLVLRRHVGYIIRLTTLIFSFDEQFNEEEVTKCLVGAFELSSTESDSTNILIQNLTKTSVQKMIKDNQHKVLKFFRQITS